MPIVSYFNISGRSTLNMPETRFRSETVHLYQLFLQEEAAFDCLSKLGELGCVEFKDVSNAHTVCVMCAHK